MKKNNKNGYEFVDVGMAEDTKELIAKNPDVRVSSKMKKKINSLSDDTLVMVKKKHVFSGNKNAGINITSVVVVTPKLIAKMFKSEEGNKRR